MNKIFYILIENTKSLTHKIIKLESLISSIIINILKPRKNENIRFLCSEILHGER